MDAHPEPAVGYGRSPQAECDLIMKGGIASGVIYPRLVCELARSYHLNSIGGTSVGAIAAAAAAAAELRRTRDNDPAGFVALERLPETLAAQTGGVSLLQNLFQAQPRTAPLFRALIAGLSAKPPTRLTSDANGQPAEPAGPVSRRMALAVVAALASGYARRATLGALPGLALIAWSIAAGGQAIAIGIIGGVVIALLGIVISITLGAYRTITVDLPANNFGLCSGRGGSGPTALTDWLHGYLQEVAGQECPVTFEDLEAHNIILRVMTTNLTQGRPMTIPWTEGGFFFHEAIWRTLFPDEVVEWLKQEKNAAAPPDGLVARQRHADLLARAAKLGLFPMPRPEKMPIVVAARMSFSFPFLISAVPLAAIEGVVGLKPSPDEDEQPGPESAGDRAAAERFSTNWFSDGGMCANLPVHFFDGPLSTRPTFAVDLATVDRPLSPPEEGNSYLPQGNEDGLEQLWKTWESDDPRATLSFVRAMVGTWQGWVDSAALRMPGYRDRVVTIYNTKDEGGLNLNMDAAKVVALAARGQAAGAKLVTKFTHSFAGGAATGFDNHRWIRLRSSLAGLGDWLALFGKAFSKESLSATYTYQQLVDALHASELPSYPEGLTPLGGLTKGVLTLAGATSPKIVTDGPPRPLARLRLVPYDRLAAAALKTASPEATPPS